MPSILTNSCNAKEICPKTKKRHIKICAWGHKWPHSVTWGLIFILTQGLLFQHYYIKPFHFNYLVQMCWGVHSWMSQGTRTWEEFVVSDATFWTECVQWHCHCDIVQPLDSMVCEVYRIEAFISLNVPISLWVVLNWILWKLLHLSRYSLTDLV